MTVEEEVGSIIAIDIVIELINSHGSAVFRDVAESVDSVIAT